MNRHPAKTAARARASVPEMSRYRASRSGSLQGQMPLTAFTGEKIAFLGRNAIGRHHRIPFLGEFLRKDRMENFKIHADRRSQRAKGHRIGVYLVAQFLLGDIRKCDGNHPVPDLFLRDENPVFLNHAARI